MPDRTIVALFCDGGLIGRNPSEKGGSWAWCGVDKDGEHIREVSAYLLTKSTTCPGHARIGSDVVTNNDSEIYAALRALEAMSDGWTGVLATDSQVTIERLEKCRLGQLPTAVRMDWYSRIHCAFKRLGKVRLVHLAGHPTKAELEAGKRVKEDGTEVRVSRHNVWCDKACTELAKTYDQRVLGWSDYVQHGLLQPTETTETAA